MNERDFEIHFILKEESRNLFKEKWPPVSLRGGPHWETEQEMSFRILFTFFRVLKS